MLISVCYLFVINCLATTFAEIRIPGENVNKNTLTTLGIKTLDWQGGDATNSSFSQVQVHHNYSKVSLQNEKVGQSKIDGFGQSAISEEDFLDQSNQFPEQSFGNNHLGTTGYTQQQTSSFQGQQTQSFGGQEQDELDTDDFSQFSDNDQAFQLEVSSQLNQGRDQHSRNHQTTLEGQEVDRNSKNYQTAGTRPHYQTHNSFDGQHTSSFSSQEDEHFSAASSNRPTYNAHSYGNVQQINKIIEAENALKNQQQFEDFAEYDQYAEATNLEPQESQVKKYYTLDKPIYVHGFKYPPDPDDGHSLNTQVTKPLEVHTQCPKMATGQFVYALSCNQFLNCWKGRGYAQNCAPGTLFNPQTLECDFASKVKCVTGPRKPEFEENRSVANLKLETGCPEGFSGVVPHHSDCSKFINCANGAENVMDCPPGTLFSLTINSCDFPYKTECASWSVQFGNIKNAPNYSSQYGKYGNANGNNLNYVSSNQNYHGQDYYNQYGQNYHYQSANNKNDQRYTSSNDFRQQSGFADNTNQNGYTNIDKSQSAQIGNSQTSGFTGGTSYATQQQNNQGLNQNFHKTIDQKSQFGGIGQHQQSGYYPGSSTNYGQNQNSFTSTGVNHQGFDQNQDLLESQSQYLHGTHKQTQGNYNNQNQLTGSSSSGLTSSVNCPAGALELFPHPYDCSKFLNCAYGRASIQVCQPGTVFNPESKACDLPYRVNCHDLQSSTNHNQNAASHGSYNQEQSQGANKNIDTTQTAGKGKGKNLYELVQNLDGSQSQYVHENNNEQVQSQGNYKNQNQYVVSSDSGAKCPNGASGLLPHPYDCSKFLNCANGQTFVQDCGSGTVFNPNSKVCDFPHKVNCQSSKASQLYAQGERDATHSHYVQNAGNYDGTSQSSSGVQWQTGTYGSTNQNQHGGTQKSKLESNALVKCPEYASGLHPHPTICSKFLNCANGQTFIQDCGPGTVFNPNSKVCDFPYNVECGSDHGEGLIDIRKVPVVAEPEQSLSSGSQHHQQGSYGQSQNPYSTIGQSQHTFGNHGPTSDSSTATNNQESYYGQNQGTDYTSSGHNQQGFYGHGQNTNTQQGHQGLYGQEQTTASNTQTQQGFYEQGNNFLGNSNNQEDFYNQNRQQGYGQNGQSQNVGSGSANSHGQSVSTNQQGYYGQSQTANGDQQVDESRNYNQQFYGAGSKQHQIGNQNRLDGGSGVTKPSPFPSTDINADYEFGNEEGSARPGTFKPVTVKPKPQDNRKRKDFCEPLDFHCSVDDCIPQSMVCDGIKDCSNGADEQGCEKLLHRFTMTTNAILAVREKDRFSNISLVYCAKSCLESKGFQCKSFSYRKDDGACFLSDTNVGYSGALVTSHPYNYYEVNAYSVNCSNLFKCPSQKCIDFKQLCDGINDCGDRIDEKGCSAEAFGYQIKLGGTDKNHEGRIELKAFGKWGFICDDKFGLRDADVVCRELGFELGALEVKDNSFYAQDVDEKDVFYLMDDVTCLGNETTLRDCDFNGWGVHNCETQEVVGIVCKTPQETCPKDYWKCDTAQECLPLAFVCDGVFDCTDQSDEGSQHCEAPTELRLAGGSSKYEGRIEVRHHGIWGTVCDDDFNDDAAKVVCKYLGFPGKATAKKDGHFGPGSGPIWLDQVFCQGNESALQHCVHWNWGEHNCEHSEDVGVVCSNTADDLGSERKVNVNPRQQVNDILPEYLFPERCGLRKDDQFVDGDDVHFRVVKGSIAKRGDYPWQASLRIKNKSKPAHWCGAVVISQKFVLTAAHCLVGFSKGAYFVVAGDYNTDDSEGTEQEVYIDEFYIHEQFRAGQKMNNDIALIKLKGEGLVFTKDVQPICLPDSDLEYTVGMNCTISGFGTIQSGVSAYSHQLRAGWIPMQSRAVCEMPHVYGKAITDGMICAGSLDEGVDACDGDSGGPLACLHEGVFTLYGLTSWGQHCGHANKPGVYVKVAHYRKWIDDTTKKFA